MSWAFPPLRCVVSETLKGLDPPSLLSVLFVACQLKVSELGRLLALLSVLLGRGAHPAAEDRGKMRLAGKADAVGNLRHRQLRLH